MEFGLINWNGCGRLNNGNGYKLLDMVKLLKMSVSRTFDEELIVVVLADIC
jgi:hypothetical protein